MKKSVSGQVVGAQMVTASDGSAFTGSVTVSVTGDGGTQATGSVGSGACTHEGNGFHTYAPAQAETNYDHVAFTFTGTGAVPVTVQIYTTFPQTGDSFARLGSPAGASVSADIATIDSNVDAILVDTGTTLQAEVDAIQAAVITNAAGTDIAADIVALKAVADAVLVDTAEIGAAGAGLTEAGGTGDHLTAVPWNAAWDAEVQSEVTDALNAYDPPTKAELDAAVANVSVDEIQATALADLFNTDSGTTYDSAVAGSVVKEIADNAGGSSLTAGDIADAVLDEAMSGHTTAGTLGKAVADILEDTGTTLPASISGLNDLDAAGIRTAVGLASANLDTQLSTIDGIADTLKLGIITGTVATGTLSTTTATTSLTGYADDQLIGRTIIFTSGDCEGEATDITDYAETSGQITFTALTTAPENGDTFKIV